MSLTTLVKTIQDIMRKDVGVDGDAQRISQMVWLLFLKIFDDSETERELTDPTYKSPLQNRFRWRNWAADPEGMTSDELLDFVNDMFTKLKGLATRSGVSPMGRVIGSVFEDSYNYMKNGTLLRQVINKIQEDLDFTTKKDRHLLGDIYEKILKDLQSAGNAGEYYTPRAVTRFIVDMVNPQLGETVLDPACGTGGFLTCTIDHLEKQAKTGKDRQKIEASLRGVEKKPLPHMLATTNMLLHGIKVPDFIQRSNMLARPYKDYGPKQRVHCIVTNPPFGGMEEDGVEDNFPQNFRTRETADLFLALIIRLLKTGGRCGMILPDGSLFGEGIKTRLKEHLLTQCNLHTIVRLPNGVFNPYTGIKTNLLFFTKGEETKNVWYYEHTYPKGVKNYNKTRPIAIEEFDPIKKWWCKDTPAGRARRKENAHAWKVPLADIQANNYNLDIKNPHAEAAQHGDPDELLLDYQQLLKDITAARDALKKELAAALESTRP